MSGKQLKRQRRESGMTIEARREQRQFARDAAAVVTVRDTQRAEGRRIGRQALAFIALAFILATIVGALFA